MGVHPAVADLDIMTTLEYVLKTHQKIGHHSDWELGTANPAGTLSGFVSNWLIRVSEE